MLPTALLSKAALQTQSKRQICKSFKIGNCVSWLGYKSRPAVHGERGNLPIAKSHITQQPFSDIFNYFKVNSSLRVLAKRGFLVVGLLGVFWVQMDPEKKEFITNSELRVFERAREREVARYSKAPPFVRPDADSV